MSDIIKEISAEQLAETRGGFGLWGCAPNPNYIATHNCAEATLNSNCPVALNAGGCFYAPTGNTKCGCNKS
jgi:hypothetical protein